MTACMPDYDEEEFDLSRKIQRYLEWGYSEENVKEFIRRLKEELNDIALDGEQTYDLIQFINLLAGDKLI